MGVTELWLPENLPGFSFSFGAIERKFIAAGRLIYTWGLLLFLSAASLASFCTLYHISFCWVAAVQRVFNFLSGCALCGYPYQ